MELPWSRIVTREEEENLRQLKSCGSYFSPESEAIFWHFQCSSYPCPRSNKNMKIEKITLYLKNNDIIGENKRVRVIALFLSQENQVLQFHTQDMKKSNICIFLIYG
ncbi:uncharacterized protein LOC110103688 isoform X2 [Dendrobium catenatum]|uniref:uncharacterized protein LOC110103688 isoform X2 n=1 Tax=Dendrobium catenatum TaxID=906689 RepID=UPI0009F2E0FD|nr:uncharacterized protein LOC110103688 isoform X2 [Dendrobium catenatum]